MNLSDYIYIDDPRRPCPHCEHVGALKYVDVPEHRREYEKDGVNYVEYFSETRDYTCGNCEGEFNLIDPEMT